MKTTEATELTEAKYPHSEITDKILKCAVEVHKTLGPGFLESIYEKALISELKRAGLKVQEQVLIPVVYKGDIVGEHRLDLLVEDTVVVENKTAESFNNIHKAQVISYLKATGKRIGLLINFAKTKVEIKRIIL
ncbi:MAG: GxxExxY protein [bacterium]|nr:GxxExxY protein [bacterium]